MALPNITIVGNTTGPAELRFTQSGKAVAQITVVANKRKRTENNGWEDAGRSPFIRVSLWDAEAEALTEALTAPAKVIVTGQLIAREYEKDGQKRESLELEYATVGVVPVPPRADREKPARNGGQRQADPWATRDPSPDPWATSAPSNGEPPF